jgi:protein SCO1/2
LSELDKSAALKYSQSVIGNKIGEHRFINSNGNNVNLSQFHGKPLLISFIYTSCHHTCPMMTNHLAGIVRTARDALGEESFSIISIGFDTAVDNPDRMRMFAHERGINISDWQFLSTDEITMDALGRETGFIFFESPKGFDHLAQTTLLDAEGRVYRQIYGANFEPPMLVEPLKELVFGQHSEASIMTDWINNVRLFCTIYDPASGRYRFDYSLFIAIGIGTILLSAMAVFLVRAWRQNNMGGTT